MTDDDALALLRLRRSLTGQTYRDEDAGPWAETLAEWTLGQCRQALTEAARENKTVAPWHLVERLPKESRYQDAPKPSPWPGPTASGRRIGEMLSDHSRGRHPMTGTAGCPACGDRSTPPLPEQLEF